MIRRPEIKWNDNVVIIRGTGFSNEVITMGRGFPHDKKEIVMDALVRAFYCGVAAKTQEIKNVLEIPETDDFILKSQI